MPESAGLPRCLGGCALLLAVVFSLGDLALADSTPSATKQDTPPPLDLCATMNALSSANADPDLAPLIALLGPELEAFLNAMDCDTADLNGGAIVPGATLPPGNGVPDGRFEFGLLTTLYNDPTRYEQLVTGTLPGQTTAGVAAETVGQAYDANRLQLEGALAGPVLLALLYQLIDDERAVAGQPPLTQVQRDKIAGVLRDFSAVLAGYYTLGDEDTLATLASIEAIMTSAVGVDLIPDISNATTPPAGLSVVGDADGDGFSNRAEYDQFGGLGSAGAFLEAALTPLVNPDNPGGEGEGEGEGDGGPTGSPPRIDLNGTSTLTVPCGSIFIDPGATASDPEDGDLTAAITVTGTVDTSRAGTYLIRYSVVDSDGNAAPEVTRTVSVTDNEPPLATCRDAQVQLDAGGAAVLDVTAIDNGSTDNCGIASRTLSRTTFGCEDVGTTSVTLTVTDGAGLTATCTANVTVVASEACDGGAGTAALTGVIFDRQTGTRQTCAAVQFVGATTRIATTNARGEYTASGLRAGRYSITVFLPGAEISAGSVNAIDDETATRNIAIDVPGADEIAIDGVVTQKDTNVPLGGVRVDAFDGQTPLATTYTCSSGRYAFSRADLGLKQGTVTLLYTAEDYETEQRDITLQPAGVTEDVPLTPKVEVSSSLSGVVTAEGTPLRSASVKVSQLDGVVATLSTDAAGNYQFLQLPAGAQSVEASAPGYVTRRDLVNLRPDTANTRDFALNRDIRPEIVTAAELREWLPGNFDVADTDNSDSLDYDEVIVYLPSLPLIAFDAVDIDDDNRISRIEAGVETGGGGICCGASAKSAWDRLGDFFVLSLALIALLAMRTATAQRH